MKLEKLKEANITPLNENELLTVVGGGFWKDLAYGTAATIKFIGYALEDAFKNPIRPSEYR